jgi:hypothetical protein
MSRLCLAGGLSVDLKAKQQEPLYFPGFGPAACGSPLSDGLDQLLREVRLEAHSLRGCFGGQGSFRNSLRPYPNTSGFCNPLT